MNDVISDASILLQPLRYDVYKVLKYSKQPLYIDQIAEAVHSDRRLVSYHLATLEEHGFATSQFMEITAAKPNPGKGKAGRFYTLTDKADRVLAQLKKEI